MSQPDEVALVRNVFETPNSRLLFTQVLATELPSVTLAGRAGLR